MEGITSVKIEPLEDFEYNFQQEEKFEIKSEIDLPIKSEEGFEEELNYYQQPECWSGPPIKGELPLWVVRSGLIELATTKGIMERNGRRHSHSYNTRSRSLSGGAASPWNESLEDPKFWEEPPLRNFN
uniref:Uncharacterized protein n=1 Tax=Timema shepardi TaxID=629360 RepID=A0A7R9G4Z9_TIMSH|nr:unnamed protein product [Timema shepardi]